MGACQCLLWSLIERNLEVSEKFLTAGWFWIIIVRSIKIQKVLPDMLIFNCTGWIDIQ
jgi:hypothetical protein